ncbi:MAG: bifunctional UDP-N-acetylmuramoyl-tripeptide:D-alanyl-D-alanine ligase/alanine racemase [Saprospiraceae bacterium]|nr:bifunctional UDP-N-acetylmuramoyl-tripeptide:D-alanyl-D-alanine ligase/alanine racemase [Saprospiraceae bacterium]
MNIAIEELANACGGTTIQKAPSGYLHHVLIDSRQLIYPSSTVFFALAGQRRDGHSFVASLYEQGVRTFVLSDQSLVDARFAQAHIVMVEDTLTALQKLAGYWRRKFDIPIIAITGSNGKTSVKDWLSFLLEKTLTVTKSPKSFNSQIGVPLSILQLHSQSEMGIFEAGISQVNEMSPLAHMIDPTHGIFTNLGSAHDAGFSTRVEKFQEKMSLFAGCKKVIYSLDQALPFAQAAPSSWVGWSKVDKHSAIHFDITAGDKATSIVFQHKGARKEVTIPFVDVAAIENALHCLTALMQLDFITDAILERFATLPSVSMRMEILEANNNCILLNDSYNADFESLQIALSQAQHYPLLDKTLILSDFEQVRPNAEVLKNISKQLRLHDFSTIILVGEKWDKLDLPEGARTLRFGNTRQLLKAIANLVFEDELIVLKGARQFRFEEIVHELTLQSYGGRLEINLDAVAHNLRIMSSVLPSETKILVMIKAAAYGSGALPIARYLSARGVDYFGVAYMDEGIALRKGGITLPIMVLNPEPRMLQHLFDYQLEPEVHTMEMLQELHRVAVQLNQTIGVHLNIDTGMHRLGFDAALIPTLCQELKALPLLKVTSIFSHLTVSDDPNKDHVTHAQADKFRTAVGEVSALLNIRPDRHLLNSNGIVRFPQYAFEMVRLGIGLYGIAVVHSDLMAVHTLSCKVSHLRRVPAGAAIGYGQAAVANEDMTIATIGLGYADGLIRKAGNRRYSVLIKSKFAPIVGNVCMDMAMIDVTDIEGVEIGDEVVIFGPEASVEIMAAAAETIPYEILTGISQRVRKIYTHD